MEPDDEKKVDQPGAHPSLVARARRRAAVARSHLERLAARAQAERERHEAVDAAFDMVDHDSEVGGGIMAGALAYRLFIWLLPAGLVAVAGLGFAADAGSGSPESTAEAVGLAGLVSGSVAEAASSSARWYALLIGIPILLFTTRSLLRALIIIHRLVWTDVRGAMPKPTPGHTLRLLLALAGFFVISGLASAARASSFAGGILVMVLIPVPYAALWVFVSTRLPHRDATWRDLVPGAIVLGLGVELLHVVAAYVLAPYASGKQGTYGSLGIAAALLFGLFLVSRLVIASAVVNATLVARRTRVG